nr:ciliogenesis-associated TTC17-interacting protein-like [Leptinotarsa decemlineata]
MNVQDEEMMQKLAFRESLLISELDSIGNGQDAKTTPVGGLCLSVELTEGFVPEAAKQRTTNAEIDCQILQTWQRAKQASLKAKYAPIDGEENDLDRKLQEKLKEYENFLKNEMKANVKKFVVHLSSQFDVGFNGGSRLTAWVDRNLHTLEEKRTEYVSEEDDTSNKENDPIEYNTVNEKTVYVAIQDNKYYLRTTSLKEKFEERKYYSYAKACHLIGEGANFLLMRYLAITRFTGIIELSALYINGDMCRNIYDCSGPMMGKVNDEEVEVCKIYRYVIEQCGIEHHCVTVMTVHGRIVTQEWEGCNYILNLNPLLILNKGEDYAYDKFISEKTWMNDMELLSSYLDYKTEAKLKMSTYMSDHPEVKDILADYLNNILLLKPENILTFTQDFFESLCPMKLARMGYFEQNGNNYDKMF